MNDHLRRLSHHLATEGPAAVHADLVRLAAQSRVRVPGASAALADATAPDIVRLRAFSVVTRNLPRHSRADRVA